MTLKTAIEPLASVHGRDTFSCGIAAPGRYLQTRASQDVRRRVGNCFVAVEQVSSAVAAYYTLAAASIPVAELPAAETKRLPHYPVLPAALIGRLAVDLRFQKKQPGAALLADAVQRTARADPAAFTLLVDAKDENAFTFYARHGFMPLASRPMSLFRRGSV